MEKNKPVPEAMFYAYDAKDKEVHIEGELIYNGDGILELAEYTWAIYPYKDVTMDSLGDLLAQSKQYYLSNVDNKKGWDFYHHYFQDEEMKDQDIFKINDETPTGYYRHLWV